MKIEKLTKTYFNLTSGEKKAFRIACGIELEKERTHFIKVDKFKKEFKESHNKKLLMRLKKTNSR